VERSLSLLLDFAVWTVLAAIVGALVYSVATSYGHRLTPAQVTGVALMIATPIAIPTAFAANLVLFLVWKHVGSKLIGVAAELLVGTVCTIIFPLYMGALAPATNWQRATLLPLATFWTAAALWIARRPSAAQHTSA
jgi:ABC-type multidrug transport system permease subunit